MRKDKIICFRINSEVRNQLKQIALSQKRSVSSLLEVIIHEFLSRQQEQQTGTGNLEKRRYQRKDVHLLGSSKVEYDDVSKFVDCTIDNISLNGVQVEINRDTIEVDDPVIENMVIFINLPNHVKPISAHCRVCRKEQVDSNYVFGAFFEDIDFGSYQLIQSYLSQTA